MTNINSGRYFGFFFAAIFFIIGVYLFINEKSNVSIFFILFLIFLLLAIKNSEILKFLNLLWIKFGFILGNFFTPIIMGFIFFTIVLPTGLLMKVLRKDLLKLNFHKKFSYWEPKEKIKSSMKNQF